MEAQLCTCGKFHFSFEVIVALLDVSVEIPASIHHAFIMQLESSAVNFTRIQEAPLAHKYILSLIKDKKKQKDEKRC